MYRRYRYILGMDIEYMILGFIYDRRCMWADT